MQDPNADTEWNDALRRFNILPPKEKEAEITEEDVIKLVENTVKARSTEMVKPMEDLTLDELDSLEDEEDERVLLEYRKKRLEEMKAAVQKAKFGELREITGEDYVQEVNKAGEGVWVVLHLYQQGIPQCALINRHLAELAQKFPQTKFLRSISTLCIRNYPDRNLPTVFVYFQGEMRKQFVGSHELGGMKLTAEGLEWMLSEAGAVKSTLPVPQQQIIKDELFSELGHESKRSENSDDENDW